MRTYGIPDYVSWYPLKDTIVVTDLRFGRSHVLNGAAATLWRHCERLGRITGRDLAGALIDKYGIDRATASRDAIAWTKDLLGKRLLYVFPGEPRPC